MLISRYRRRPSPYAVETTVDRSRLIARSIIGAIALLVIWYLGSTVLSLFDRSTVERSGAVLSIDQPNATVDVSLQGAQSQRAENNLKMYAGDRVTTRTSTAVLRFFDGTSVRLDTGTELTIEENDERTDALSLIQLTLGGGRIWVVTPTLLSYSGAITRTVDSPEYSIDLPADFSGLLSRETLAVTRSSGLGARIALHIPKGSTDSLVVGEGQMFTIDADARTALEEGTDPYELRDPVSAQLFKDGFVLTSYAQPSTPTVSTADAGSIGDANDADLTIVSPGNMATVTGQTVTVRGRVSGRVFGVHVNGYDAPLRDGEFSLELALGDEENPTIQIDATDEQGITISSATRTVKTAARTFPPVRLTAPVGSGQILTTSDPEVEITGEAPANAAGIIVNDYRLQLFKPGNRTFSYLASANLGNLVAGRNVYAVVAVDKDATRSPPATLTIIYEPQASGTGAIASSAAALRQNAPIKPGTLSVDAPVAGRIAVVKEKETVIEGRTDFETATVSVNGYTLSLYTVGKTTWNYIASTDLGTMKAGRNIYRIVARNAAGEVLDVLEYTIDYEP